jgi:hypothetical protein
LQKDKLNMLAIGAKNGEPESYNELLRHYYRYFCDEVERNWYRFIDETKVLADIKRRFDRMISRYEYGDFDRIVKFQVKSSITAYAASGHNARSAIFYYQATEDTEDRAEFQLVDDSVDIELEVTEKYFRKEKIALLAGGDKKKLAILNGWMKGFYNESELAARLSEKFGGTFSGNRSAIIRFKEKCEASVLAETA